LDLDDGILIPQSIKGRHHPMPTKVGILTATATALGIAVLFAGNPVNLANVAASLVDNLGLQPRTEQSAPTPTTQSTADAEASPPAARDTPARDEIAASDTAAQDQTEKTEPSSDDLFRQFQAWAADKAQADVRPVQPAQDTPQQVVPDAPAQAAENARVNLRIMQERQNVRPVHEAQAEMRTQNPRKKNRRTQNARVQTPPAQDPRALNARAQGQPVQNAEPPSFLQSFGVRN
jgi:hypothetical protein